VYGSDAPFRASVVAEITQRRAALFADDRVVPAWTAFLLNATRAHRLVHDDGESRAEF
jgi:hypothetical protein